MTHSKKFLHCTMLAVLSMYFTGSMTGSASATTITNLDEVPHNITVIIGGKEQVVSLLPYGKWQSNAYPIKIKYGTYTTPALKQRASYTIWKDGYVSPQRILNGRGSRF